MYFFFAPAVLALVVILAIVLWNSFSNTTNL